MPASLALALSLALVPSSGVTRYVDVSLTTGADDGSSWLDAFRGPDALPRALTAAASGDQIWVADGTYLPTATSDRAVAFQLKNGVAVYGGFAGGETALAQRDPALNVAILSGDLAGDDAAGNYGENSYHVVFAGSQAGETAVLDGFTVRGGNGNGPAGPLLDRGGGLICRHSVSPTIRRCRFTDNRANFGGAVLSGNSSPTFSDCVFEGNTASIEGGAVNCGGAAFDRCVFRGNTASEGAALNMRGYGRITDSLIYENTSTGTTGAAVHVETATTMRNCTVVANLSIGSEFAGIYLRYGGSTIANCVVVGNTGAGGASGPTSQIAPVTAAPVTYTLTRAGHAGTGNIAATPVFDMSGALPYRLAASSPGVDAGDNAAVQAGPLRDLEGAPRFADAPAVPDTGSGTSPLVDMGAFERAPDCNGNGAFDWIDIEDGTSLDGNGNAIPDECDCPAGPLPFSYCTAQINSALCVPQISFTGLPSTSSGAPFSVHVRHLLNNRNGFLFYGHQVNAAPLSSGTLCVLQPVKRTPIANTGGSASGVDCTGTLTFDFNAWIGSGADPSLIAGRQVNAQFWSRDSVDPLGGNLTDAVEFVICH